MTFALIGLKRITHVGAIGTGGGSVRSLWAYLTNDDSATVETANYFDDVISEMKKGDIIFASLDIDGTPTLRQYVVDGVTGHVTISRDVNAVTGDQTAIPNLGGTLTGTTDGTIVDVAAPTDTPASADALRDDIATVMVPAINTQLKELQAKLNAVLAMLRTAGLLAT